MADIAPRTSAEAESSESIGDVVRLPGRRSGRSGWIAVVISAAWLTVVLFVAWPALRYPVFASNSNIDSAFFAYAGELLRTGGRPYVSFWDHKPPLIYLIEAAALTVSGGHLWGLWAASLAALLASVVLAYRTLRLPFGVLGATLGVIFFAFSLPHMLATNLAEEYALPIQWATALLLVRWRPVDDKMYGPGLILGVLGAMAFSLKANLIGTALSVGLALTIVLLSEKKLGPWLRLVAGALSGFALVAAVLVGYVALGGPVSAFWDQVFHYNFVYSATTPGLRMRVALDAVMVSTNYGSFLLPFAGWVVAAAALLARGRRESRYPILLLGVVWLPIEVLLVSVSGRLYAHYYVVLLPPLSFLVALATSELVAHVPQQVGVGIRRLGWATGAVIALSTAIVLVSVVNTSLWLRDYEGPRERNRQITAVVQYVRTHSQPDAPLLVWGHASDVYFFSGRRPASRFIYALPLLTPGYANAALVRGFVGEVEAAAPSLIIDATPNPSQYERLVPSLGKWDPKWHYPNDDGAGPRWWTMTPALKMFYDYVGAHYTVVDSVGPWRWPVYRRGGQLSP